MRVVGGRRGTERWERLHDLVVLIEQIHAGHHVELLKAVVAARKVRVQPDLVAQLRVILLAERREERNLGLVEVAGEEVVGLGPRVT